MHLWDMRIISVSYTCNTLWLCLVCGLAIIINLRETEYLHVIIGASSSEGLFS